MKRKEGDHAPNVQREGSSAGGSGKKRTMVTSGLSEERGSLFSREEG